MDLLDVYDAMNSTDQVIDNWFASNESMVTSTSSVDVGISIPAIIATAATTIDASTPSNAWLTTERTQIICYVTILLLAIIGNTLVILTLIQNRRMRTITNLFLLNLAISDVLLGVLCMPITLVGTLLRDFIFGEVMCKLLPYLQGTFKANESILTCRIWFSCELRRKDKY